MKSAVIITSDNYPCGDAGAVRQHAFAKILQSLDYKVLVLGYGKSENGMTGTYEGVDFVTFRPNSGNILIRVLYRLVSNIRMVRYLRRKVKKTDLLLVVGVRPKTYGKLKRFAKKHNCTLVHDSVEWYSPEEYKNGSRNRSYRANEKLNTQIMDKDWRVISISHFLHEHFEKKCKKSTCVPVIMDVLEAQYRQEPQKRDKTRFVYAGAPGRKDNLALLLEGFSMLTPEQLEQMEIRIVGVTKQALREMCGASDEVLEKLSGCLNALGRVPRAQAVEEVMDADFSILLRNSTLRYAKAGFPTKIVESLMCGTPVFCNLSSDLGLYLKDGENAVLIHGHDPEDVKNAAQKALLLSPEERQSMRQQARETALKHFDYRNYIEQIGDLLK